VNWQYTFSHNSSRYLASAIFRANDCCLQRLRWTKDGSYVWELVRITPRIKI
jgi:hypothetical protein